MSNEKFKGDFESIDAKAVRAFSDAALSVGWSVAITPLGDDEYNIVFFVNDEDYYEE